LLALKMAMFFIYFIWLILNHLDNQLETYPLVRVKYLLLMLIFPFSMAEFLLLWLFALNLDPMVITSCCGSIYDDSSAGLGGTMAGASAEIILPLFFLLVVVIGLRWWLELKGSRIKGWLEGIGEVVLWSAFFIVALFAVVSFMSTYIYEMLSHKCPFCLLKGEYHYIGIPLYLSLFAATATGLSRGVLGFVAAWQPLEEVIPPLRRRLKRISYASLGLFILVGYAPFIVYYGRTGRLI